MTPLATRLVEARPNDEAPDPGVESIGIPKPRQVSPGLDESILDGVLGQIGIPQDQPGDGIEARERRGGEIREGLAIAALGSFHQLALHVRPIVARSGSPRYPQGGTTDAIRSSFVWSCGRSRGATGREFRSSSGREALDVPERRRSTSEEGAR